LAPIKENTDVLFDETIGTRVGGLDFHAYPELGETDDASWIWVSEKKAVFAGDLVIWSIPNVGNPFKVQRYTEVKLPEDLMDDGFLSPRYGNPTNLFPPKRAETAREMAALAGKERIMERARELRDEGRANLALQFVDMALATGLSAVEAREMHLLKAELLDVLGKKETSLIARSIFFSAKKEAMKSEE